ncbi:NAD-dependent epimerase/dehydratase family protein [Candidatus Fermentibacteria bacterium]|nr:NAD-dependent epimerase/dehydratase family protein [Candidatus Fermentibacteria bacterium]
MAGRVLVTGGAGFIGSHMTDLLMRSGYEVRALDNLDPQVHGEKAGPPDYLKDEVELVVGDVRSTEDVRRALDGCRMLVHFAAAVGVGQSMYRIEHYTSVNSLGAAVLLEAVASGKTDVERMLVASSMSIYGEGLYECPSCGRVTPRLRPTEQLESREWEVRCPHCSRSCSPLPVPEDKPLYPTSVYAINKRDHEEMFIAVGDAYDIPTTAMRFFNVYGERQALSNPYTGVGAIFASRLLNDKPPVIFEDGEQSRDFVHVSDITRACLLALHNEEAAGRVFNVGTGKRTTIMQIARAIARELGKPEDDFIIKNQFRAGDIRHCFADVTLARDLLGFEAEVGFDDGVGELCNWVADQTAEDLVEKAVSELDDRGLTR